MDISYYVALVWRSLFYSSLVIVLLTLGLRFSKNARRLFFAHLFVNLIHDRLEAVFKPERSKFLNDLREERSKDAGRLKRGQLRILEIGVGTGENFRYYPPGTSLICVDPNPHFMKYFDENREKFPNVEVEKFISMGAEDIDEVEDNSVDVAVSTHVLCSVEDVDRVLRQVKRVLVNGGKFYYAEHVASRHGGIFLLQKLLEPLWKIYGDNCHLHRNIEAAVLKSAFSEVSQETRRLSKLPHLFDYHTFGIATK